MAEAADFLREAVAIVARELMEAEISTEIGATRGEVSAERATHRNGYRPRRWETRVGEIELADPRKRGGASYLSLLPRAVPIPALPAVVRDRRLHVVRLHLRLVVLGGDEARGVPARFIPYLLCDYDRDPEPGLPPAEAPLEAGGGKPDGSP